MIWWRDAQRQHNPRKNKIKCQCVPRNLIICPLSSAVKGVFPWLIVWKLCRECLARELGVRLGSIAPSNGIEWYTIVLRSTLAIFKLVLDLRKTIEELSLRGGNWHPVEAFDTCPTVEEVFFFCIFFYYISVLPSMNVHRWMKITWMSSKKSRLLGRVEEEGARTSRKEIESREIRSECRDSSQYKLAEIDQYFHPFISNCFESEKTARLNLLLDQAEWRI